MLVLILIIIIIIAAMYGFPAASGYFIAHGNWALAILAAGIWGAVLWACVTNAMNDERNEKDGP